MAKYRKLPVEVEAIQFTGSNYRQVFDFFKRYFAITSRDEKDCLVVETLEGEHIASPGDYIIKGVAGELYPCKPDILAKTYELVED